MKTTNSQNTLPTPRNAVFMFGLVLITVLLVSWNSDNTIEIQNCVCDASASAGTLLPPICIPTGVKLAVNNTYLPNDNYEQIFIITDENLNIIAYATAGSNDFALFDLPQEDYVGWHLVYSQTALEVLPPVGVSLNPLLMFSEQYDGCVVLSEPSYFSCSFCDPAASGGTVFIQPGLEGFTSGVGAGVGLFCGDASVRIDVTGAVLPNATYESVFMITDAALNIVAYVPSSNDENGIGLFGTLPTGVYSAWYVVYFTGEFPALLPVGANVAPLAGAAGDGSGCLSLSSPVVFEVAEIIEIDIVGFECIPEEGYLPIVQISGGCPELTGFGVYNTNAGFVSGVYVDEVGITSTVSSATPAGAGQTVILSVVADGCACGSEVVVGAAPAEEPCP